MLHDELGRLPDKYRLPIVLTYLEGKSNEEVAELLEWPVGTVKGRLFRARNLLRSRLSRRGLVDLVSFLRCARQERCRGREPFRCPDRRTVRKASSISNPENRRSPRHKRKPAPSHSNQTAGPEPEPDSGGKHRPRRKPSLRASPSLDCPARGGIRCVFLRLNRSLADDPAQEIPSCGWASASTQTRAETLSRMGRLAALDVYGVTIARFSASRR